MWNNSDKETKQKIHLIKGDNKMLYNRNSIKEQYINKVNSEQAYYLYKYIDDYCIESWSSIYEAIVYNWRFTYETSIPYFSRDILLEYPVMDFTDLIMLYYYDTVENPTNYEDIELPKEELRELTLDFIEDVITEKYDELYCRITQDTKADLIRYLYGDKVQLKKLPELNNSKEQQLHQAYTIQINEDVEEYTITIDE